MHVCHMYLTDIVYNIEQSATHNVVFFYRGALLKLEGGIVTEGHIIWGHFDREQNVQEELCPGFAQLACSLDTVPILHDDAM